MISSNRVLPVVTGRTLHHDKIAIIHLLVPLSVARVSEVDRTTPTQRDACDDVVEGSEVGVRANPLVPHVLIHDELIECLAGQLRKASHHSLEFLRNRVSTLSDTTRAVIVNPTVMLDTTRECGIPVTKVNKLYEASHLLFRNPRRVIREPSWVNNLHDAGNSFPVKEHLVKECISNARERVEYIQPVFQS